MRRWTTILDNSRTRVALRSKNFVPVCLHRPLDRSMSLLRRILFILSLDACVPISTSTVTFYVATTNDWIVRCGVPM